MAANKTVRLGPVFIANSAGNLFNPPTLTGGVNPPGTSGNSYYILKHIRIVNKTGSPVTFTLYIGATGGSASGTEFVGAGNSVAANSYVDWYGVLRLDVADFLTGVAGSASALVIEAEGEIGVN